MPADKSIERFESVDQIVAGSPADHRLARQSAVVVAVLAAFLAIATFLSNEAVKEVITGETHRADVSAKLEDNQLKIDVAGGAATMLRVLADGPADEARAAKAAMAHEHLIETKYEPADRALTEEMHHDEEEVDHHNTSHLIYELAQVALEVGIVLGTVSIIARRRWLLNSGIAIGIVGAALLLIGFVTI